MANATTTNLDPGALVLEGKTFADELLTFGGAATAKAGTILARDSSTNKLVLFVKGGVTNGNGVPKAVLTYEVVAAGAGDKSARVLTSGKVSKKRLVIQADGDATNVDGVVLDQLRDYGITNDDVAQLGKYDNATV